MTATMEPNLTITEKARQTLQELMERGESYGKESLQSLRTRLAPAVRISEDMFGRARESLTTLPIPSRAELAQFKGELEGLGQKINAFLHLQGEFDKLKEAQSRLELRMESLEKKYRRGRAKAARSSKKHAPAPTPDTASN